MEHAEALEESEGRDGGVEVEAGRKSGAEREAEGLQRIHMYMVSAAAESRGA
jgi:hypothetical protein